MVRHPGRGGRALLHGQIACGWLKDKYGLCWQIVPARFFEMIADPDRAAQVTQATFSMTKFDIAALEKAYSGD